MGKNWDFYKLAPGTKTLLTGFFLPFDESAHLAALGIP
jgi:hypothetical protein